MTAESHESLEAAIGLLRKTVLDRAQLAEETAMLGLKQATANRDQIHRLTESVSAAVAELTIAASQIAAIARRLDAYVSQLEQHLSDHVKLCTPATAPEKETP